MHRAVKEWRKRFPEQAPEGLRIFIRIFREIISAVKVRGMTGGDCPVRCAFLGAAR